MRPLADVLGLPALLTRRTRAAPIAVGLVGALLGGLAGVAQVTALPQRPLGAHLPPPPGTTSLVSVDALGGSAGGPSAEIVVSSSGRFVAFSSRAADLAPGDTNETQDVFFRDRRLGETIQLPLENGRLVPPGGRASEPAISADGRFVAFTYLPPAPPPPPTPSPSPPPTPSPSPTFFVGEVDRPASYGRPAAAITPAAVVQRARVLVWSRESGETVIGSVDVNLRPADDSGEPALSADGTYLAFTSIGRNIAPNDKDTAPDVFRVRWQAGERPVLVSVGFGGTSPGEASGAPSISADGQRIAFESRAGDSLIDADTGPDSQVYLRDLAAGTTTQISVAADGSAPDGIAGEPAISANGRRVAFTASSSDLVAGDTNQASDVFIRDVGAGRTTLASVALDGGSVAGASGQPSVSSDGRVVAFVSTGQGLVAAAGAFDLAQAIAATEVYARDVDVAETIRISVATDGGPGGSQSVGPSVNGDGRFIGWTSRSDTLTRDQPNQLPDVFIRDLPPVPLISPATIDFGARAVGLDAVPGAASLSNAGWAPLAVQAPTLTGPADFRILLDGCSGKRLLRGQACTVTVGFRPAKNGARTASLQVPHRGTGSPGTVRLIGTGSRASLELTPDIGAPGIVTIAEGRGFPADTEIVLRWSRGISPKLPVVRSDAQGRFRVQVLVFHHDLVGDRELIATAADGTAFPELRAAMRVVQNTSQPPVFALLRSLRILVPALVYRG